jgi:branched-chain amino acid transport system permease protein
MMRPPGSVGPILLAAGWVALAVGLPLLLDGPYEQALIVTAAVFALLGTSVNICFGYLGQVSFGHAAFFGLGAYVAGLLATLLGVNYWLALLPAMAVAGAAGALVGFASLRVGGAYFAIATLTFAEILRLLCTEWVELTRGPLGMVVMQSPIAPLEAIGLSFAAYHAMLALLALGAVQLGLMLLMRGPVGRAWLAIRESTPLAEAVGIPTLRHRVWNMALSGAVAGLAGGLFVPKIFVLTPDLFGASNSATGLLIAILGGRGTLVGPVLGGAIFALLPELLRAIEEYRMVLFALLLLLAVRLLPSGLAGGLGALLRLGTPAPRNAEPMPAPAPPTARTVPSGEPILVVEGVTKRYRGLTALSEVSFAVPEGAILGLIGPNGAGKSTLLGVLSAFIRPDAGTMLYAGREVATLEPHEAAALGLVRTFQHTTLYGSLSAFDNVLTATYGAAPVFSRSEAKRRAAAAAALAAVGLAEAAARRAEDLPYGEQRRLAIAVALAARPRLLLLDEPAAGLNPTEAAELATTLRRIRDGGVTVVIVDHNMQMMMGLCDRLVVLHHGRLIGGGTPAEVAADGAVVAAYLGAPEEVAA